MQRFLMNILHKTYAHHWDHDANFSQLLGTNNSITVNYWDNEYQEEEEKKHTHNAGNNSISVELIIFFLFIIIIVV